MAPRSLYLHFPFCSHRCHYCDFSVKRASEPPVDLWIDTVEREAAAWFDRQEWTAPLELDTVFVGGGTPSLLGESGLTRLRERLDRWFTFRQGGAEFEWTVEANPASFTRAAGRAWRDAGVTRLSLGVQSLDDDVLRWLGRLHDRSTALRAIEDALAGFDRVSVDVMFGLPGEYERDLGVELDELVVRGVGHVSVYGLTVEPRTPLARWIELGRIPGPDEGRYEQEYRRIHRHLTRSGLVHYEVSNYAAPGEESRHNWQYWLRAPYLGLGPSAHGFLPPVRSWNAFRWEAYRRAVDQHGTAIEGSETVTGAAEELERAWLGLRTRRGVAAESGAPDHPWSTWEDAGWVRKEESRWVSTTKGWLRMDELVSQIAARAG